MSDRRTSAFSAKSAAYEAVQRGLKDLNTEYTDGQRLLELERARELARTMGR
jgi:hypothetical protein